MSQALAQGCFVTAHASCSGRAPPRPRLQSSTAYISGRTQSFHTCNNRQLSHRQKASPLLIECALTRAQKEASVAKIEKAFAGSSFVFGMRFKDLSVKTMTEFRHTLPEGATTYVCKNTLFRIAAERQGWQALVPSTTGENAWVFVNEECIADSVKAYDKFLKKLLEKYPKEKRKDAKPTAISGAVLDNQQLDLAAFKKLESMPTRLELIATIAGLIKQVPTKVAVGIQQIPLKVAYGIVALSQGDENKDKLVSDVFPKPPADPTSEPPAEQAA